VTRKISGADPRVIAAIKGLVAGATNTALAAALEARMPALPYLVGTLTLGFFGYGISLVLFILALRHLGAARTSAYFSTAPFIGAVLAIALFGQPAGSAFWIAALLMIVGVCLHANEHHDHEHAHEGITHVHSHTHDAHHQHTQRVGRRRAPHARAPSCTTAARPPALP
jgi:drug/metabolite transporter (DMT)-like permease